MAAEEKRAEFERRLKQGYPGAVVRRREQIANLGGGDEVVWYATMRRYGSRISKSVEIRAPQQLVFDVYVNRFADWMVGVKVQRMEVKPGVIGTEYRASYELFGRTLEGRFRIVDADPPWSVRVEARGLGGIRVWYVTTFQPSAKGAIVEVLGDYEMPARLLPGVGKAFEQVVGHEIDRGHKSLRAFCEREVSRASGRAD
jgi:hypothetical protein